jgi:hypothetical protein
LVFNMQAALRSKAQKPDLKGREGMDEWTVTLTMTGTRHPAVFSYWMGTSHRRVREFVTYGPPTSKAPPVRLSTAFDEEIWAAAVPMPPSIEDVLTSLATDTSLALEMPRTIGNAMQYLIDEGCAPDNPRELYELVEGLQRQTDMLDQLLRGTGATLREFTTIAEVIEQ